MASRSLLNILESLPAALHVETTHAGGPADELPVDDDPGMERTASLAPAKPHEAMESILRRGVTFLMGR